MSRTDKKELEFCTIIASGYEMCCEECGGFTSVGSCLRDIPEVVTCGECGARFKSGPAEHCEG